MAIWKKCLALQKRQRSDVVIRLQNMDSEEAGLQIMEVNPTSSKRIVSGELGIAQPSEVHPQYDLSENISRHRNITKLLIYFSIYIWVSIFK